MHRFLYWLLFSLIFLGTMGFIVWSGVESHGNATSGISALTAWGLTSLIDKIIFRHRTRFERWALNAEKRSMGYPIGWRIHLPWNARFKGWNTFRAAYYARHDFTYVRGLDVGIDPKLGFETLSRLEGGRRGHSWPVQRLVRRKPRP